jgi:glycosyltransferase 2 family protein
MKRRDGVIWVALPVVVAGVVILFRDRIHFDWAMFWLQLKHASLWHLGAGVALIYGTYWLRAVRWAVLVAPTKKVAAGSLVGQMFVGFTAVALFGRLADLTRPYLIAKKIALPLSSQVAVYTMERMFDLGAAAIIFSSALAFTPKAMPHHELFVRTGLLSLGATLALAVFAVVVRVMGGAVAGFARSGLGRLSQPLAESVAGKIEDFRDGMRALASAREFGVVVVLSLAMWGMIGGAYLQTAHAFVDTPELAGLTFSRTMLLMAASLGGSLLQLPVVGWFTQIAVTAGTMHALYGAPIEVATACGAMLLVVMTLSIVPAGLVFARVEHVNLKQVAAESEAAAESELGVGE